MELIITPGIMGYRWELHTNSETLRSTRQWMTMSGAAGEAEQKFEEWLEQQRIDDETDEEAE